MSPLQWTLAGVFGACAFLVVYSYVVYAVVIWCLARLFGRRQGAPPEQGGDLPPISLLVAAHNEEDVIEERVHNALAMDYPRDKLEIVIASDGSTDATPAIVERYAPHGVRLLKSPVRRGKAATLNRAFGELRGKIVIMSDANTAIDPGAPRKLVRWFDDPEIGVVCGRLVLTDSTRGTNADGLYWRYETFLKRNEGRLGGLLGANGAIYAVRRESYCAIPDSTIVDDFVIPLLARLERGCRVEYDAEAVGREETPAGVRDEFGRRSRIGAGGFQSLAILWRLLNPRRGWVAFTFLSHKVLRWLCPFFLVGMMACNLALWHIPLFRVTLVAQLAFYLVAFMAAYVPSHIKALKPLRLTTMFAGMNLALLVGFLRWLLRTQKVAWKRTSRLASANGVVR